MTKSSKVWLGVAIAGVLGVGGFLFLHDPAPPEMSWDTPKTRFEPQVVQSEQSASPHSVSTAPPNPTPTTADAAKQEVDDGKTFRVDPAGNLIVDEQTRLKIEELLALTDPGKVDGAMLEKTQDLPPAAARRAEELVRRFRDYTDAQRATYPPGVAPLTEDDAVQQLDGLHALRVQHFGPEVATAFYANEEKLSRELIELMRLEKDKSMTMDEKAARAQAMHDQLPTVAAIERNNRAPLNRNSGDRGSNPPEATNH